MKTEGKKFDQGKPAMELLSTTALMEIAKVMGKGKDKYGAHNWREGLSWSRVIGAAFRHLSAFNGGEDLDPETGLSHIAHLGCCAMFLLEYINSHPELDDRYKKDEEKKEDPKAKCSHEFSVPLDSEGTYRCTSCPVIFIPTSSGINIERAIAHYR